MRKPTPVTTASMMRVRWSTAKAKSTWKPVMAIHGQPASWRVSGAPVDGHGGPEPGDEGGRERR